MIVENFPPPPLTDKLTMPESQTASDFELFFAQVLLVLRKVNHPRSARFATRIDNSKERSACWEACRVPDPGRSCSNLSSKRVSLCLFPDAWEIKYKSHVYTASMPCTFRLSLL